MTFTANDLVVGPVTPAVSTTLLSIDFYFESEDHLEVYQSGVAAALVLNTDYTVSECSAVGVADGSITLATPANGTDTYAIYCKQPVERTSDLQFRGDLRSPVLNLELDRMWRAIQGVETELGLALKVTGVSAGPGGAESLTAASRINKVVGFSGDGTTLAIVDPVSGGGGGDAFTTSPLSQFAATTSAELAGVISDETGTDKLVFSASPALTGTPTAPTAAPGTNTTQISTTAFVQAAIAALVDASPAALDTLNELAAALGDDPNFATTMTNALAGKAAVSHTHAATDISDSTAAGRTLLTAANAAAQRTALNVEDGADVTDAANVEVAIEAITLAAVAGATGDEVLIVDATDGGLKAVLWENLPGGGGGLADVVDDLTPQLGGDLDVNGSDIVSVANGNIRLLPNGTGNVVIGTLTFDGDQTVGAGQDNFVLTYDHASGTVRLEALSGGGDMLAANNLSDVASAATSATNLGLGTGDSPQFTAVNVGHATDTTITRVGAGVIAVEGNTVALLTAAQTLTNKTLQDPALVGAIAEDVFAVTGTTPVLDPGNGSLQTWTLTGTSTPTENMADGESITLMVDDGTGFSLDLDASVVDQWIGGSAPTLPTTGYAVIILWKVGTTVYASHSGDLS